MRLSMGCAAIPVQGAITPCSCANDRLKGLACGSNVPFSAKWERADPDDRLEAFRTQAKLSKWVEFRIDNLHEDIVAVAHDVAPSAWIKSRRGSAMAWDVWAAVGMGKAAVPMQAGSACCG